YGSTMLMRRRGACAWSIRWLSSSQAVCGRLDGYPEFWMVIPADSGVGDDASRSLQHRPVPSRRPSLLTAVRRTLPTCVQRIAVLWSSGT
ncbi:hypothetical protein V8D89_006991, partial [Ganoderma adspersum]